ncbi:MAG: type VI secretion system protein TssA [Phycisphaerae bacterium]
MATSPILDFAALAQPIAGDHPCGPDLRRDPSPTAPYRMLKEQRRAARQLESQLTWDDSGAVERPDWGAIAREAPALLANVSKDLEVGSWLAEALTRVHGFAGLRDGLRACRELCSAFWDGLHPNAPADEPDDDEEFPLRVASVAAFEHTLVDPIRAISLVESSDVGPLGTALYEQAQSLQRNTNPDDRARRLEQGLVPLDKFEKLVAASSREFYGRLLDDAQAARQELKRLADVMTERCGDRSPSLSTLAGALDACERCIRTVAKDKLGERAREGSAVADGGGEIGAAAPATRSGPIRTREDAFAAILAAAQFFRDTEPHSVLSWHLEECVRFGRMSLPELLTELIGDSSVRENLFRRVGIPSPKD